MSTKEILDLINKFHIKDEVKINTDELTNKSTKTIYDNERQKIFPVQQWIIESITRPKCSKERVL
jgi:hypothetical protein